VIAAKFEQLEADIEALRQERYRHVFSE